MCTAYGASLLKSAAVLVRATDKRTSAGNRGIGFELETQPPLPPRETRLGFLQVNIHRNRSLVRLLLHRCNTSWDVSILSSLSETVLVKIY